MWYKTALHGRILSRYQDLNDLLKKHIYKCRIKRKSGYHLDFFKLNALLPEELKKYINDIQPIKPNEELGVFYPRSKVLKLPYVFDQYTIDSIIHEFVHAVHNTDFPGLKYQGSGLYQYFKLEDLKNTYNEFLNDEKLRYIKNWINSNNKIKIHFNIHKTLNTHRDENYILKSFVGLYGKKYNFSWEDFKPRLNERQWEVGRKIAPRVKKDSDLYYATNEELLAYMETAIRFFSVENLLAVQKKYYPDNPDEFVEFVKQALRTIGFEKTDSKYMFKGLKMPMYDLINRIKKSTSFDMTGGILHIVEPHWWRQLSKNIWNNLELTKQQIQTQSSQSF